jgi:uncharacterized phage protein (TIGR02218 family)
VDLDDPAWKASGVVSATDGASHVRATLPGDRASGLFDTGMLAFTSGANAGRRVEVLRHLRRDGEDLIDLWQPMAAPIATGDAFTVSAGCDKRFATCRDRFANAENFRGFPHMPGNDFALSYASSEDANTGGRLRD